jgi:single-stranded-DNA-specific exonuclease
MPKPKAIPPTRRRPPSTLSARQRSLPPPTASEAAFERLLAHFDEIESAVSLLDAPGREPATAARAATEFLDALFAKKGEYLARDRFASIGEADDFYTKIVGVSFEGRQDRVGGLKPGDALELERQPENEFDPNAIAVKFGTLHLGFLRREIALRLAPNIDGGDRYSARVDTVTGGGERHVGVNIHVRRHRIAAAPAVRDEATRELASTDGLRIALIGERPLRDAQHAVLERVSSGRNTLAVLGTGRGKSLCFQLPAAERALERGEKTLVFYPLRALANDQYDTLVKRLGRFGLRIFRANGAIDGQERTALEAALEDGSWDIILSTPEFATYHRRAFACAWNQPHLVVVDEAHHIFESRHRAAYGTLGDLVRELGAPQVLALTATANDEAFRQIRTALDIESWVIDPTVRENLQVVDARNTGDKNAYLARELEGDGKAIVYTNSRAEATKLAERLRSRVDAAVAFYHAGVPTAERARVEDLFRDGEIRIVVATSAFGEGIDLPDVRDVVLYHLNFNFTEFNQMAGRAGRDGDPARIHLLYGESDRKINDFIIAQGAPSISVLRELYRGMRGLASDGVLRTSYEDVARTLEIDMVQHGETVSAAIRIFEEAALVATGSDDEGRFVRFLEVAGRVDLTATSRYAEGVAEREAFERFCDLALTADAPTLEQIVNRPIYPDGVPLAR